MLNPSFPCYNQTKALQRRAAVIAVYDKRGREVHLKIRRGTRPRFRLWMAVVPGLFCAALGLSLLWQRMQMPSPDASETHSVIETDAAGPSRPIVVDGHQQSREETVENSSSVSSEAGFGVRYQVPQSEPVSESYFDDALFVGDSITVGISVCGAMENAQVIAANGINPLTILSKPVIRDEDGALHTVPDMIAKSSPGKIYIQLGANGIARIDRETFLASYRSLLETIRTLHPNAQIYVQSVFPVTREKSLSENGILSNGKIDSYNEGLMLLCEEMSLPYLNVAEALKGADGALPADASADGIHMGRTYYEKWFSYLCSHTADTNTDTDTVKSQKD